MKSRRRKNFLIMGAGVLGSGVGGLLASAGYDVTLVGRERIMKPIREKGLRITGILGERILRLKAVSSVKQVQSQPEPDIILLTTKAYDTEEAVKAVMELMKEDSVVLSLQNGIGNVETIAELVGKERTLGGMIITGFEWVRDAEVSVTVSGDKTKIGELNGEITPRLLEIADAFSTAGLPTEAVSDIQSHIWSKALFNASLNPLSAIFRVPYGELANPYTFAIIREIVKEAFAVAKAEHVKLLWGSYEEYLEYLEKVQLPRTAKHRSSMLKDIENGKRTEIDYINGIFVRLGEKHNIPTPVNETLVRQLKFLSVQVQNRL